jgi:DNA-binding Lrp family transcriptional regulator
MTRGNNGSGVPALQPGHDLTPFETQLISVLQEDGRRSYRQIAVELGTTEKQVRSTLQRLQAADVVQITAVTFPSLLGYSGMATIGIRAGTDRCLEDIAADLAAIRAVDYVALTAGPFDIFIEVICRDPTALLETLNREIRTVDGVEATEVFLYLHLLYQATRGTEPQVAPPRPPQEKLELSSIDREIVGQLATDGRTPYQTIAKRLGISEGQVRQRTRRLVELGALRVTAIANPLTLGYQAMAWVGIRAGSAPLAQIVEMLRESPATTYIVAVSGGYDLFIEVVCASQESLMDELDRMRSSGLVARVDAFPYLRLHYKRLDLT